ncbi:MAG: aminotransferase DegT [Verrucomicrobiales bacterium]|nr:aminotransferase DegT [Verrucomicrobiales bacterium]
MTQKNIPFIDLQAQRERLGANLEQKILEVVREGKYINGPQVAELEEQLSAFSGSKYVIGCASGTDGLLMPLWAWGIGPGDAVFVPAFTFVSSAEVVAMLGATPVFVDVDATTFNMDIDSLNEAIDWTKTKSNLNPKAVIAVDLFGLPADLKTIETIAKQHEMKLLVDCAQGFGSKQDGKVAVCYGDAGSTSFFPAKPLGCYGDGGAIFTDDPELEKVLKSMRAHGQGSHRYEHVRLGMNGRLDTLQAAILLEKLKIYPDEINKRNEIAARYTQGLKDHVDTPTVPEGYESVWAQYTLKVSDRDALSQCLSEHGIPTMVYYPIPLSHQPAYKHYPMAPNGVPNSEKLSTQVLSLPIHPYLDIKTQNFIIEKVQDFCKG